MPLEDSRPHVADVIEGLRAYAEGGVDIPWELPAGSSPDVDATIAFIDARAYVKNW